MADVNQWGSLNQGHNDVVCVGVCYNVTLRRIEVVEEPKLKRDDDLRGKVRGQTRLESLMVLYS